MRTRRWKSRVVKKGSGKKIFFFVLVIMTFLSLQSFIYIEKNLRDPLMELAKFRIKQIANEAIHEALTNEISQSANYEKLVDWKTDNNGKITGFMINYAEHMKIVSSTTKTIHDTLNVLKDIPDYVPIGQALDSAILASYGPDIKVKFNPEGTVQIDLKTRQKDAGINMLLVEVYIHAITEVKVIVPFNTGSEIIDSEIPISYLLVVGDVPMYYFDNKGRQVDSPLQSTGPLPPTISLPPLVP